VFTALGTAFGNNEQHIPVPVNRSLRKIKLVNESTFTPGERAKLGMPSRQYDHVSLVVMCYPQRCTGPDADLSL